MEKATRRCARCGGVKPREAFPPGKRWPDGLYPYCRDCKRAKQREDYAKHREKRRAEMRARYAADPEPYKQRTQRQREADPELWLERVRQYQARYPDRVRRYRAKWTEANRERIRAGQKQRRTERHERVREIEKRSYRKRHTEDPDAHRENVRRRRARQRRLTTVPFTPEQLAQRMAYWGDRCWVCDGTYEAVDHVKPMNKGGAHILANLRPICTPCNTRKSDTWPYSRQGV